MGKILRSPGKVVIKIPVEEALFTNIASPACLEPWTVFNLAFLVRKFAEAKAVEKKIPLSGEAVSVSFNSNSNEFEIVFLNEVIPH
jgi:hypothetical protein